MRSAKTFFKGKLFGECLRRLCVRDYALLWCVVRAIATAGRQRYPTCGPQFKANDSVFSRGVGCVAQCLARYIALTFCPHRQVALTFCPHRQERDTRFKRLGRSLQDTNLICASRKIETVNCFSASVFPPRQVRGRCLRCRCEDNRVSA